MTEREPELFFDIVRSIGHGGHADVYLVRLRATGGVYAGKFLREAWDPHAREGFRREAMRQDRVGGQHVVPIIAWNLDTEKPFIILEYMPNGSLADELQRRGKFSPVEALSTIRQIAVALAEFHAHGVVHRDLKPGNILRTSDGRLVLNDLGIAATMTFTEFVRAPGFVGTPAYAAPEQELGLASPKSDVFALGIILHELVMGSPGPRIALPSHIHGPAARHVDALIERLCARDVPQRPTSAEVVALVDNALRAFREVHRVATIRAAPIPTPQPKPDGNSGNGWGWLVGAAALVMGAAALSNRGSTWDPSVERYRGRDGKFQGG